VQYSAVMPPT